MCKNKKHAIFIGASGFPIGMAAIQRQKLLAKALILQGWRVTVICSRSIHEKGSDVKKIGRYEGIRYIYLYEPQRKKNFFLRNIQKLFSPILEFILLNKLKKRYGLICGIVSIRNSFIDSFKYFLFALFLKFKLVLNLVEIYKDRTDSSLREKINDYLFNKNGQIFFNKILPISHYIIEYFNFPARKSHYLPIVVDAQIFESINLNESNGRYFLFCGSAAYIKSIEFILESFRLLSFEECKLILVTNGSNYELQRIDSIIKEKNLVEKVVMKKKLVDLELFSLYKSSQGLLLPLFNTLQDQARFPHKLAEYLSSGRPVLSNPIGETNLYLKDKINGLLSPSNDPKKFSDNMNWVLSNPDEAKEIGNNGRITAFNSFDFRKISEGLSVFLLKDAS